MVWWMWALLGCAASDEAASVTILVPEDGATVCGTPLRVELDVRALAFDDPDDLDGPHVDVMLNGQDVQMVAAESFDVPGVADAVWQLKVELSGADHAPIVPYAGDFVYVTVAETACAS
jgi:hypothetical protein